MHLTCEALEICDTLVHFKYYLLATHFTLKTDRPSSPVKDSGSQRPLLEGGAPMLRDICEFDFAIKFVKSYDNKMANALTHLGYEWLLFKFPFETEVLGTE